MSLNPTRWPHGAKLVAAFAVLYIVWGSTYLAIRIGLQADMPPALFSGLRLAAAGALLLGLARLRGTKVRMPMREYRVIAVVGIFLLVGGMYGTVLAEQYISSGLAALIVALLPLWIAAAESILPDMDRPSTLGYIGLAVGFLGLGILMWPKLTDVHGTSSELKGVAIQVVATWLWTTGSVISKRYPLKTDGTVATGFEMGTAGIVLLVIGTAFGEWPKLTFSPAGTGALVYLIVIGSALAFSAFMWLLRNAPASKVMTYAYVNPVVAVFLGWLVLREPVDAWTLAGMIVIVAGVAIATGSPTRPPRIAPA